MPLSFSFPIFENPYPMDIHESPVTCTAYFADCPPDIIPVLYSIGAKHKKTGYSHKVCQSSKLIYKIFFLSFSIFNLTCHLFFVIIIIIVCVFRSGRSVVAHGLSVRRRIQRLSLQGKWICVCFMFSTFNCCWKLRNKSKCQH